MNSSLQPYPTYKEAGVPWLGQIPAHWELRKMKRLLRERSEKGFPDEPLLAATQTKGVVRKEDYENRTVLALKDLHLLKLVRVGDFVISLRSFQGGIEYARHQGIISPAYTILYPVDSLHQKFLAEVFKSKPFIEQLTLFVTGIRQGQNIDYGRLRESLLPMPPNDEQIAIARYLDHADRQIRRFIHAKRRTIELLNEQKQAIIHQAVTRGLDPNVPLKPSGVEWLGDIPAHWERRAIRQLFEIGRGRVISHEYIDQHPGPYPVYSSQTENSGIMGSIDTFMFEGEYLTWTTDGANAGTVFKRAGRFNCTNVCGTLLPRVELDLAFIQYALSIETKRVVRLDINPKLMNNMMAQIRVNYPPPYEQQVISNYLSSVLPNIDTAIAAAQREIDLIREHRTRLIADVVTGRIDVRAAAQHLPSQVDEAELWGEDASEDEENIEEVEEASPDDDN